MNHGERRRVRRPPGPLPGGRARKRLRLGRNAWRTSAPVTAASSPLPRPPMAYTPLPRLPTEFWGMVATKCDLATKAALVQVCRDWHEEISHMPLLQLARGLFPEISMKDAPDVARKMIRLAELLATAPCINYGGASVALKEIAGEWSMMGESFVSMLTATSFLGLTVEDLPAGFGYAARDAAPPRAKCTVQHHGPCLSHAPGYRVECAKVYSISQLLRAMATKGGIVGITDALVTATKGVSDLRKRKTRGIEARRTMEMTILQAGLKEEDVSYITGLEVVQKALFGLEEMQGSVLTDALKKSIEVHKRLRPRYLWLWATDGKARRKATLFLNKGLERKLMVEQLVDYLEAKFWWAKHPTNIASMPLNMKMKEENALYRPGRMPVSPGYSSTSSGSEGNRDVLERALNARNPRWMCVGGDGVGMASGGYGVD